MCWEYLKNEKKSDTRFLDDMSVSLLAQQDGCWVSYGLGFCCLSTATGSPGRGEQQAQSDLAGLPASEALGKARGPLKALVFHAVLKAMEDANGEETEISITKLLSFLKAYNI